MQRNVAVDVPVNESTIRRVVARITPYSRQVRGQGVDQRPPAGCQGGLDPFETGVRRKRGNFRGGREKFLAANDHPIRCVYSSGASTPARLRCGNDFDGAAEGIAGKRAEPPAARERASGGFEHRGLADARRFHQVHGCHPALPEVSATVRGRPVVSGENAVDRRCRLGVGVIG